MTSFQRYFGEFFNITEIVKDFFRNRELIRSLTLHDFQARFRGSFGGALWSFIQPLFMMAVYTLVFSAFLKVRFGSNDSPLNFSVFLLCGLLPWNSFSEVMNHATGLIRANPNFVKRVVFPLQILPITLVLVAVMQQLIGFILLLPLAWFVTGRLHATLALLPVVLALQLLLYLGISLIWSSLATFLPDLRQITALMLAALIFLTPIMYPEDIVPAWALPIIRLNPMSHLVTLYRTVFLGSPAPPIEHTLIFAGFCLLVFLLGWFWFNHTKKAFADIL